MKKQKINHMMNDFKLLGILDLGLKYLSGKKEVYKAKGSGKKVIGSFLPPMEMIYAIDNAIPIFLPRLIEFEYAKYIPFFNILNRFRLFKHIINYWDKNNESRLLGMIFNDFDQSQYSRVFSGLIDIASSSNYYMDTCVQTRISYGAFIKYFNLVDMIIGGFEGNYCLHFSKFYERIGIYKPTFYFEMPYGDENSINTVEIIDDEFDRFIKYFETLTGHQFKDERLIKILEIKKEIYSYLKRIHKLYIKGYVPLHAAALTLIHGCYVDLLSDPNFCLNKIKLLTNEIYRNFKSNEYYNYVKEGIPRIIICGSPGFDPALPSIFESAGASFLYLDLFQAAKDFNIKISKSGLKSFKEYLIKSNFQNGISDLVDLWIRLAKNIKADGILFSKSWGCRFTTPIFKKFKEYVMSELSIPVLGLDFYFPGENLGQVKTRIDAFIEMIK
ncbi:MAG: 2-hydroxyacyl-CoA dehydratase [Candidatus Helarchaeota archaeon]